MFGAIVSPMTLAIDTLLRRHKLRKTHAKRVVLSALSSCSVPLQQKDIRTWAEKNNESINLVTIYRVLEQFEKMHIVHRSQNGGFTLCSVQDHGHHHVLLSCSNCGTIEERTDSELCRQENRIAKDAGFVPKHHVSEILGLCRSCH